MPEFVYEALHQQPPEDQPGPVGGRVSAENVSAAIAELESQGLVVQSIRQVKPEDDRASSGPTRPAEEHGLPWIPPADRAMLQQRIAQVLQRRDVLTPALAAFAEEMPPSRYRRELRELIARLESGTTAEEFCTSPDLATSWLPLLAGSGSPTGTGRMLQEMLAETNHEKEIRRRRLRVWAYPLVVTMLAFGVLAFLAIVAVPVFSDIFQDFQLDLPKLTLGIIWFSDAIRFHPLSLLLSLAGLVATMYVIARLVPTWRPTAEVWGYFTRGGTRELAALASFTQRLAELVRAGLSLPTALRLAIQDCSRVRLRRAVNELATYAEDERVALSGSSIAKVFPSTLVYALQSGDGKPNVCLLDELAGLYADRVRNRVNLSTGLSSQFAVVVVGIVVGLIVLALLLPLIALIEGLTGGVFGLG